MEVWVGSLLLGCRDGSLGREGFAYLGARVWSLRVVGFGSWGLRLRV